MGSLSNRRNLARASRLCSQHLVVNGLRLLWIIVVVWCEIGSLSFFFLSLSKCRWPDKFLKSHDHDDPTHVLLVSDTQVLRPTINSKRRMHPLGIFRRFLYHSNLKKSWNVVNRFNPHAVIFLGDMLASGSSVMSEKEYEKYYTTFKDIFLTNASIPTYFLPGNNDVGLGVSSSFTRHARHRFSKYFNAFNQEISIRNHTFVLLDSPGLVEEDYQRSAHNQAYDQWNARPGGPVEFVRSIAESPHEQPMILFSHIPMFRPDTKSCGPLREKGTIRRGVGNGYQNTLGKHTTSFLLDVLRPSAIFSADNRDYCEYTHVFKTRDSESKSNVDHIREITIKSFSPAKNIKRPGFQLLSLSSPTVLSTRPTFSDAPCFFPDNSKIYSSIYLPCILLTVLILFFSKIHRKRQLRLTPLASPVTSSPTSISCPSSPHPGGSALWSPFIPFTPTTPNGESHGSFFPSLRTANALAPPSFRASSRPDSPRQSTGSGAGSPLLSPALYGDTEGNEVDYEDALYPAHYATRRDSYASDSVPDYNEPKDTRYAFLPAPGMGDRRVAAWSWSWSFVLGGRRRRMTLRVPSFRSVLALLAVIPPPDWVWIGQAGAAKKLCVGIGNGRPGSGVAGVCSVVREHVVDATLNRNHGDARIKPWTWWI